MLLFHDRVAVVTGAGAGLGRSYALLLAARGAKVVVNDLGGSRSGDGSDTNAADTVVSEIKRAGGIAVADYNSVVEGHKIIKTAINTFGRIDILINNAGILRDKAFQNMSISDWDIIHDVHMKAAFITTQAAWKYFRSQKYGRVIFTSSNAGLFGNFGQVNYSAAKMGLIGLCNTVSIEGKKYNINANVIVPTAASRLTEDILPPDIFEQLKPELIAPVVIWLCHEGCEETGSIIESAAGWAGKYSLVRGKGALLRETISDIVTPENVQSKWGEVTNVEDATNMESIQEVTYALMTCLEKLRGTDDSTTDMNKEENLEYYKIDERALILYALGIGASVQNIEDLKYLYENHCDFTAFPTFAFIPAQMAIMSHPQLANAIPNTSFDLTEVLHGEQYLEIFKPMPIDACVRSKFEVVDVLDKGRNAVIICGARTYDENDEIICYNEMAIVAIGKGGFGGKGYSDKIVPLGKIITETPDVICSETTAISQGAIYRLSGDSNPLHIDPDFAKLVAGFKRPILHGLCTLGFSARHVLARFAGNNPAYFKAIKARFVKPFLPGDTLKTLMWRENNRIYFQTQTINNEALITGAYVDLHRVVDVPLPPGSSIISEFDKHSESTSRNSHFSKLEPPLGSFQDSSSSVHENTYSSLTYEEKATQSHVSLTEPEKLLVSLFLQTKL